MLKEIRFKIVFKLVRGHPKSSGLFRLKPEEQLIKMHNEKAQMSREECSKHDQVSNIKCLGFWAMKVNSETSTNSVKETVRIIDAKDLLKEHVKGKFKHNVEFLDIEAQRVLNDEEVTASVIKCLCRCNHFGVRNTMTNKKIVEDEHSQCNEPEMWYFAIRHLKVLHL